MIFLKGEKDGKPFWEIQKDPLKALCTLSKKYDYKVFEANGRMYLTGKSWKDGSSIKLEIRELTPRGAIYWDNHRWDKTIDQDLMKPGYSRRYKSA